MKSNPKELNKTSVLVRLERNQNDLRKMKSTLNSYVYEPRTPRLFEYHDSLKHKLENLSSSNGEVLRLLKGHKQSVTVCVEQVAHQFQEFHSLRKGIEDYISGTLYQW